MQKLTFVTVTNGLEDRGVVQTIIRSSSELRPVNPLCRTAQKVSHFQIIKKSY